MLALTLVVFIFLGATLAGSAMIVALVMGFVTGKPLIAAAVIGFAVAIPLSWVVARRLSALRGA